MYAISKEVQMRYPSEFGPEIHMCTRRSSYETHWFVGPWQFYKREWPGYPISPIQSYQQIEPQLSWMLMASNVSGDQ